jgi:hypothetical protein
LHTLVSSNRNCYPVIHALALDDALAAWIAAAKPRGGIATTYHGAFDEEHIRQRWSKRGRGRHQLVIITTHASDTLAIESVKAV